MTDQDFRLVALKAAEAGDLQALELLVSGISAHEADGILNHGGYNLLHFACGNGHLATTQWLTRRFRTLTEHRARCGRTPLEWATHKGKNFIAEWLSAYLAAANVQADGQRAIVVLGGPLRPGDDRCSPPLNAATHGTDPPQLAVLEKKLRIATLADMSSVARDRALGELPGLWLKFRLEEGLRLWDGQGGNALLVFTGGDCGSCSGVVEAEAMRAWTMNRGVPADAICLDTYACNTVDNAWYVARILNARHINDATIVTSRFHIERTKACFDPILGAFGGVTTHYQEAPDGYDGIALEQRLKLEQDTIPRFSPHVREAVRLIRDAGGNLGCLREHLYTDR